MASSGVTWSLNRKMEGLHNLPDVYWIDIILHSSGNSSKTAIKDKEKEECQQMYEKRENREIIQKVQHPSNISFRTDHNPQPPASSKIPFFSSECKEQDSDLLRPPHPITVSGGADLHRMVRNSTVSEIKNIIFYLNFSCEKKYSNKDWKSEWYQLPQQQF